MDFSCSQYSQGWSNPSGSHDFLKSNLAVNRLEVCQIQIKDKLSLCSNITTPTLLGTLLVHDPDKKSIVCFEPQQAQPGDVLIYTGERPYGISWQTMNNNSNNNNTSIIRLEAVTTQTQWSLAGGLQPLDFDTATDINNTNDFIYPVTINPSEVGFTTSGYFLAQATIPLESINDEDRAQAQFQFELNTTPLPGICYTPMMVTFTPPGTPIKKAFSVSFHTLFFANPGDIWRITGQVLNSNNVVFQTINNTLMVTIMRVG